MIKKTAYAFLFFLVLQFVLFSCCKEKTYAINLQNILIFNETNEAITTTSEDLLVYLNLIYDYRDITFLSSSDFNFNSALATTCPDNIYIFESEIIDLNITADTDINGIAAGESLNNIMKFSYYDTDNLLDITEFYNPSDDNIIYQKSPDSAVFVFNEVLPSQTEFKLTITIQTSNSNTFTAISNTYIIE